MSLSDVIGGGMAQMCDAMSWRERIELTPLEGDRHEFRRLDEEAAFDTLW